MNKQSLLVRRLAWITLLPLTLTISNSVDARPPRARVDVAVIESVDSNRQELRLKPLNSSSDAPPPLSRWSRITLVTRDGQPVEPSTLEKGMTVRFSHRTPFFGSPFATNIKIIPQTPPYRNE
jgi:hypothetical protein